MTDPLAPTPGPANGVVIEADHAASRLLNGRTLFTIIIGAIVFFVFARSLLLIAVVVGIILLLLLTGRSLLAALRWRRAALELAGTPLRLGSTNRVVYRRPSRRGGSGIGSFTLTGTLQCVEEAEYRQGTDRRTARATVHEATVGGQGTASADGLVVTFDLPVPLGAGAPSFDLGNNSVHWYLETSLTGSGVPGDTNRFQLVVGPEVDRVGLINEVGDR